MRLKINRDFERYRDFVAALPQENYQFDKVFRNRRNVVGIVTLEDGVRAVVKNFKPPTWVNSVVYTFFRPPKTRRAYDNALLLLEKGIDTALPIGYVEKPRFGLYHTGYFVQEYIDRPTLNQVFIDLSDNPDAFKKLLQEFLEFTVMLHEKKVLMKDNNIENVLVDKDEDGNYHFALIDVNRLFLGKQVTLERIMRSLGQLQLGPNALDYVVAEYCRMSGQNLEKAKSELRIQRNRGEKMLRMHRLLHKLIGKKDTPVEQGRPTYDIPQ